jgi:hypothetical protein
VQTKRVLKYSDNIDYLVSAIFYLGTHTYWWGRTCKNMARELSLDTKRLQEVFDGFPGIFKKSQGLSPEGTPYYSLQARYAQYDSKEGEEPKPSSDIAPLDAEKLSLLLDFVQKMAEHEKLDRRGWITGGIAAGAAVLAALVAIAVGVMNLMAKAETRPVATDQSQAKPR